MIVEGNVGSRASPGHGTARANDALSAYARRHASPRTARAHLVSSSGTFHGPAWHARAARCAYVSHPSHLLQSQAVQLAAMPVLLSDERALLSYAVHPFISLALCCAVPCSARTASLCSPSFCTDLHMVRVQACSCHVRCRASRLCCQAKQTRCPPKQPRRKSKQPSMRRGPRTAHRQVTHTTTTL